MVSRIALATFAVAVSGTWTDEARAQAAAEEAVILSGTSAGQGRAARGLGNAVRGSINGATRTIRSLPAPAPSAIGPRTRSRTINIGEPLAADSDPLENTDAPAYQLSNGATIRVSGRLRNSASAVCRLNCPEDQQATPAQEEAAVDEPVEEQAPEETAETEEPARTESEAAQPE